MTILVATVTVVFDGTGGEPAPERFADALLAEQRVTTVRVGDHGSRSVFRADVEAGEAGLDGAAATAASIAARVAAALGGRADVLSVALTTDADRIEHLPIPGNNFPDGD